MSNQPYPPTSQTQDSQPPLTLTPQVVTPGYHQSLEVSILIGMLVWVLIVWGLVSLGRVIFAPALKDKQRVPQPVAVLPQCRERASSSFS
jgi:hypothetical protein